MSAAPPADRPRSWEWAAVASLAVLLLAFGVLVEIRSAFQKTSKSDFGVYARAAWAVRSGADPYAVTDSNGWHYCYPLPLAVALTPLADPPPGASRAGYLPFSVSVAVWYLFGLACVGWAAHVLARAVLPDEPTGSRRWWYARTIPVLVCLGGLGFTLGRGQVNLLLVALVAGMFAAAAAGRRFASGVWLAGAIALKVIPGLLVLYPLLRRDGRALGGLVVGLVVLLGAVPAAVWGVPGAVEMNRKVVELVLEPGATGGGDQTRAKELTNTTSTDSQSFVAAIHAHRYPNRFTRPPFADPGTRLAHWSIGAGMTLATGLVGWRLRRGAAADQLVLLGCLCVVMMLTTPVSHMHYYAMAFPLVAGLWLRELSGRPRSLTASPGATAALVLWGLLTALPLLPGPTFDRLREAGLGTAASVGLWALGLWTVSRRPAAPAANPVPLPRAA